eukprot:TRINITY_DN67987_c1_g1_i2.p1 TRINITY_DN67987_c1_g1~~TRINITY_DN67987_c1_g1_i2.p1  ORF type:complete len:1083 (-),score=161.19 TRINITY_DN67987_c1_g1_i2:191-3439(-)
MSSWGDPTLHDDELPQPYRFLNKLVFSIIGLAIDKAAQSEVERACSKTFKYPIHLPMVPAKQISAVGQCMVTKLCNNHIFMGKEDGSLEIHSASTSDLVFQSPPLFSSGITQLSVVMRTDGLTAVAVACSQTTAGIKIVLLSPLLSSPDGGGRWDDDSSVVGPGEPFNDTTGAQQDSEIVGNANDTVVAIQAAHVTSALLGESTITEIILSPEGQKLAVVLGWIGKVLLFDTSLSPTSMELPSSSAAAAAIGGGEQQQQQAAGSSSAIALSSAVEASKRMSHMDINDNKEGKETSPPSEVSLITHAQLIATTPACIPLPTPAMPVVGVAGSSSSSPSAVHTPPTTTTATEATPTNSAAAGGGGVVGPAPYPLVHFLCNTSSDSCTSGSVASTPPTTSAPPTTTHFRPHTLLVAWRGINTFTTYPLQEYNPYLPTPLALPRESTADGSNNVVAGGGPTASTTKVDKRTPTPSKKKGTKDDKQKNDPLPTAAAPTTNTTPDAPNGLGCVQHMLPTLVNCSCTDNAGELVAFGCSDGVLVVWNTILGVPKCMFTELSNRVQTRAKHACYTYSVDLYQHRYCVSVVGMPKKAHSCNVNVYDIQNGVKLHSIKYLHSVSVAKCLPTTPFVALHASDDNFLLLCDLVSGETLCGIEIPITPTTGGGKNLLGEELPPPPLLPPSTTPMGTNSGGEAVEAQQRKSSPPPQQQPQKAAPSGSIRRKSSSPLPSADMTAEGGGASGADPSSSLGLGRPVWMMVTKLAKLYSVRNSIQCYKDHVVVFTVAHCSSLLDNAKIDQPVVAGAAAEQQAPAVTGGGEPTAPNAKKGGAHATGKKPSSKQDKRSKRMSVVASPPAPGGGATQQATSSANVLPVGTSGGGLSKEINVIYFSVVNNLVTAAYPLMQDLCSIRDSHSVHKILNNTTHAERTNTDTAHSPQPHIVQSLRIGTPLKGMSDLTMTMGSNPSATGGAVAGSTIGRKKSPRGQSPNLFTTTTSSGGGGWATAPPTSVTREALMGNSSWGRKTLHSGGGPKVGFAAEVTVAADFGDSIEGSTHNPATRIKRALAEQEFTRMERQHRVKQHWNEMKNA